MLIKEIKDKISLKDQIYKNDNLELKFINNCKNFITNQYGNLDLDIQIFQKFYEVKKNKVNNYLHNIKKLKRNLNNLDEDNEEEKENIKKVFSKIDNYINNRSKNLIKFFKLKENYQKEYKIDFDKNEEIKNFMESIINKMDSNIDDKFIDELKNNKKNYKITKKKKIVVKQNIQSIKKSNLKKFFDNDKINLNDKNKNLESLKVVPSMNAICNSKTNITFAKSDKWVLKFEKVLYYPKFLLANKIVVRFLNEDFFFLNESDFGCLCMKNSTGCELNYDFIINYEINNKFNEDLYFMIYHICLYYDEYLFYENPLIWGFSIFHLNKENFRKELKKGLFEIPIYLPYFLKMDRNKFKNYYKLEKFERYPLSSIKFFNKPQLGNSFNGIYKRFNFTFSLNEKKIQKYLFNQKKYKLIDILTQLGEGGKLENIDDYLQLGESSILNFPKFWYYINDEIEIHLNINGFINNDETFSNIKVITDIYSINKKGYIEKKSKIFDKNSDFSSNKIILMNNIDNVIDEIYTLNDFLVFKIYKIINFDTSKLKMVGWSIIPIFYDKGSLYCGDFVLPVIKNNLNEKALEKIITFHPRIFCYLISKNKFYNNLFIDNKYLIISINNNSFLNLTKNPLPKIIPENLITIFIPQEKIEEVNKIDKQLEEFSKNINNKDLDNFNKNIDFYYLNINKDDNLVTTKNVINNEKKFSKNKKDINMKIKKKLKLSMSKFENDD